VKRLPAIGAVLGLALLLGGCAAVVVGAGAAAGYSVYEDRRSSGTQVEDQRIESRASSAIEQRFGWNVHVNVTSYNRQVLITGEVPDAVTHAEVEKLVATTPGVRTLSNELVIGPLSSLAARTGGPRPHAEAFVGKDEAARNTARLNFIGIVFCMMFGTAALPHILMRYYTTPSVQQARVSVFWSLFFIFLLYFTAPCLAVLAKYDMYSNLVGSSFASLPAWAAAWAKVDPGLLNITDINKDGIVQWAEVVIGGDLIVLATPEIAGLPYVVSGLVAAGGLAAALSTADGLLLTIANALSHDLYYKMIDPQASTARRVTLSKTLLVVVAFVAAYVAALKPANILFLVSAAFSFAAAA